LAEFLIEALLQALDPDAHLVAVRLTYRPLDD